MKKFFLFAAIALSFMSCASNASKTTVEAPSNAFETSKDKYSYALGMDLGSMIKRQVDADLVDYSILMQGIRDLLDADTTKILLNDSEYAAAMQDFMNEMRRIPLEKNLTAQNEFLKKIKAKMAWLPRRAACNIWF